jgi:hypothetical protein
MIDAILSIAGAVLGNVIADFITEKRQSFHKSDIEARVDEEIRNYLEKKHRLFSVVGNENDERIALRQKTVREVVLIAHRYPDFQILSDDEIKMKELVRETSPFTKGELRETRIQSRIRMLDDIISQRRKEMEQEVVSGDPPPLEDPGDELIEGLVEWEMVDPGRSQNISKTAKRILDLEEKISNRRSEN